MDLHVPPVLQHQSQEQDREMNWLAANSQQLQRDMVPQNNKTNCLLSQEEYIWDTKEVMQLYW